MNRRRLAVVIGVLAIVVGAVALVAPGTIPLSPDRVLITTIGVLALAHALRVVQRRRDVERDEATTPDPERAATTPRPGDDLRDVLGQFLDRRGVGIHLHRISDGLSAAVVAVLTRFQGLGVEEANERLAAGTWTDDAYAADFLADEAEASLPLRRRLRDKLARESSLQRRIRHTIDAIAAIADRHRSSGGQDADGGNVANGDESAVADDPDRPVTTTDWLTFEDGTDEVVSNPAHSTERWRGISLVALVGIGVGVVVEQPAVLLAGVVGIGYAAYARSAALPPGSVSVDRTLDTESPTAGEEVTVTVTVRNDADRPLPDLRIVDGVPAALSVTNGSPRCGTALRAGEQTSFSYAVRARRGRHAFGPTLVVGRDLAGSTEEERHYETETTLTCVPSLSAGAEGLALRRQATRLAGRQETDRRGEGIEFAATREYRPGDPLGRIDWNRRARTRELTTVEFREERAASVVLLIDARPSAYVSPGPDGDHAVDRAVAAAGQLLAALTEAGHRVGIAAAGSPSCWLAPGSGVDHRADAKRLLALDPALGPTPTEAGADGWRWQRTVRNRLERGTQIVFLTPLVDEAARRMARQFDEEGFPVTVLSPDATSDHAPGHRLARVARRLRVARLRGAGIPVIEWGPTESLDAALARYGERRVR